MSNTRRKLAICGVAGNALLLMLLVVGCGEEYQPNTNEGELVPMFSGSPSDGQADGVGLGGYLQPTVDGLDLDPPGPVQFQEVRQSASDAGFVRSTTGLLSPGAFSDDTNNRLPGTGSQRGPVQHERKASRDLTKRTLRRPPAGSFGFGRAREASNKNGIGLTADVVPLNPQPGEELWVIAAVDKGTAVQRPRTQTPLVVALMARIPKQSTLVPAPLKHTDVAASIDGYIASVNVVQQFHNPFDSKIEAVYMFPLPHDAGVNEFVMTIGERRIRGIIRERKRTEQI